MKLTRLLILAGLLGGLITMIWKPTVMFLHQNHVVFLLNQNQLDEADKLARDIAGKDQQNVRTQFLVEKINVLQRRGIKSRLKEDDSSLLEEYPRLYYWRALDSFRLGDPSAAYQLATQAIMHDVRLPDPASNRLLALLGGKDRGNDMATVPDGKLAELSGVEKEVLYTQLGILRQAEGRFAQASSHYIAAYDMGMRAEDYLTSCVYNALYNEDFQQADFYLAQCNPSLVDVLYKQLRTEFESSNRSNEVLVVMERAKAPETLEIARLLSWVTPYYVRLDVQNRRDEAIKLLNNIQGRFPHDVILQMQLGRSLEAADMRADALVAYNRLMAETRALQVLMRVWQLKGLTEEEIAVNVSDYMKSVSHLKVTETGVEEDTISSAPRGLITERSSRNYQVVAPHSGEYSVTLIARNLPGKIFQAVVPVRVKDSKGLPVFFSTSSQDWDCFKGVIYLSKGLQTLKVGCHVISADGASAERGVQIMDVFVTESGAR